MKKSFLLNSFALAVVGLLVLGCTAIAPAPTPTPTPVPPTPTPLPPTPTPTPASAITTTQLEDGWVLYTHTEAGFAIALPPTWESINLDAETLGEGLEEVSEQNPEFAALLNEQIRGLVAAGLKFFAFDFDPQSIATGFATNLSILAVSIGFEVSLDDLVEISLAQYKNLSSVQQPVFHRRVNLMAGEAEEFKVVVTFMDASGQETTSAITQYLLVRGEDEYVVTFTTTSAQAETYAPIFERSGLSFRWLD